MRKWIHFLLAGILIVSLAACGKNNTQVEESSETAYSVQKGEAAETGGET